jgi:hypothetical protein
LLGEAKREAPVRTEPHPYREAGAYPRVREQISIIDDQQSDGFEIKLAIALQRPLRSEGDPYFIL